MSFSSSTTPRRSRLFADRELQRRDARAEPLLQLVERARERRALAVELVDEDRARDAALLGELPRDLGLHLDAFDRGDDEQREVGGVQRGRDVADEVGVAGRVEEVDLVAVELERRERRATPRCGAAAPRDRSRRRSSRLRPCPAGWSRRREQQRLGQRGLAGAAVARPGRRCGSWPSGTSSPTNPLGELSLVGCRRGV